MKRGRGVNSLWCPVAPWDLACKALAFTESQIFPQHRPPWAGLNFAQSKLNIPTQNICRPWLLKFFSITFGCSLLREHNVNTAVSSVLSPLTGSSTWLATRPCSGNFLLWKAVNVEAQGVQEGSQECRTEWQLALSPNPNTGTLWAGREWGSAGESVWEATESR